MKVDLASFCTKLLLKEVIFLQKSLRHFGILSNSDNATRLLSTLKLKILAVAALFFSTFFSMTCNFLEKNSELSSKMAANSIVLRFNFLLKGSTSVFNLNILLAQEAT